MSKQTEVTDGIDSAQERQNFYQLVKDAETPGSGAYNSAEASRDLFFKGKSIMIGYLALLNDPGLNPSLTVDRPVEVSEIVAFADSMLASTQADRNTETEFSPLWLIKNAIYGMYFKMKRITQKHGYFLTNDIITPL